MLIGPAGLGKRSLAAWMVKQKLARQTKDLSDVDNGPEFPFAEPMHADLQWVRPEEGKNAIGVEQIRNLVDAFSLTSYEGNGKVGVIEPANSMTVNAANSLLKTLEEPSGNALLILVADRVGKLPATIFSRCQRVDCVVPPQDVALSWLERNQPGAKWKLALNMAGGAPLAALQSVEQLDAGASMAKDLNALGQAKGSAIETAARWSKMEPHFVFCWLAQQVKLATLSQYAGPETAAGLLIEESVLRCMDTRNLFCYLDIINRLRAQPIGSYNVQLSIEGLLIDWAEGLRHCAEQTPLGNTEIKRLR